MRKILLICYYFPPMGLGGVGRPLNLFRELKGCNWDCHVLTVKPVAYRAFEPELLSGLDTSHVYRSGSRDPQRLLHLLGIRTVKPGAIAKASPAAARYFPDSKKGWVSPAVKLGRVLCENHRYDALISTSPPISTHLVGRKLHQEFGTPWLCDFRDYWTIHKIEASYSRPGQIRRAKALKARLQSEAAAVTAVNAPIGEYVGASHVIPNGYIAEFAEQWQQPPSDDKFTIGLIGHFHANEEPREVIELLRRLQNTLPDAANGLRLLQVGLSEDGWLQGVMQKHGVEAEIERVGLLTRRRTIQTMARSHVVMLRSTRQDSSAYMPGRLSELVASGRPIIVFADPEGAAAELLRDYDGKSIVTRKVDAAVQFTVRVIESKQRGEYAFAPLSPFARRFSSTAMVQKFAHVLDGLI